IVAFVRAGRAVVPRALLIWLVILVDLVVVLLSFSTKLTSPAPPVVAVPVLVRLLSVSGDMAPSFFLLLWGDLSVGTSRSAVPPGGGAILGETFPRIVIRS